MTSIARRKFKAIAHNTLFWWLHAYFAIYIILLEEAEAIVASHSYIDAKHASSWFDIWYLSYIGRLRHADYMMSSLSRQLSYFHLLHYVDLQIRVFDVIFTRYAIITSTLRSASGSLY